MKISVIIPCLNECHTVGSCVKKAMTAIIKSGIHGEVIVADNGSTDGSQDIAQNNGAKVINVPKKGYGNALMGGIQAAQGHYIMMGDADESYDFLMLPQFLSKLEEGFDLVQGCRLKSGGGTIISGAMPFLHKWIGNPFFSWMVRIMFNAPVHDVNCGMRAFNKDTYKKLDLQCTGMEFAVEMVLKFSLVGAKIAEIPITLHPDGRKGGKPHLRTFRDGWRTLVFFLVSSPRWLFLYPGTILISLGTIFYLLGLFRLEIMGVHFDLNTSLISLLSIITGYQAVSFAITAKIYGMVTGFLPFKDLYQDYFKRYSLEKGLFFGAMLFSIGAILLSYLFYQWWESSFGSLDRSSSNRIALTSVMFISLGVQTVFFSFLLSILGFRFKKKED